MRSKEILFDKDWSICLLANGESQKCFLFFMYDNGVCFSVLTIFYLIKPQVISEKLF